MFHQKNNMPANHEERVAYWRKKLEDLELPDIHLYAMRGADQPVEDKQASFEISPELAAALLENNNMHALIAENNNPELEKENILSPIIFGTFLALMYRYTAQSNSVIGYDGNLTMPVSLKVGPSSSIHNIITNVVTELSTHTDKGLPPLLLHSLLPAYHQLALRTRTTKQQPYDIQCSFYQNKNDARLASKQAAGLLQVDVIYDEASKGAKVTLNYSTRYWAEEQIGRLTHHWQQLLRAADNKPRCTPGEVNIATPEENLGILKYNDTTKAPTYTVAVPHVLSMIAEKQPDHPFLVFYPESSDTPIICTWKEFDDLTGRFANYLREKYPEDGLIALSMPRSIEMFVYAWGVMKAGKQLFPMDAVPDITFATKKADSKAMAFIVNNETKNNFDDNDPCLNVDNEEFLESLEKYSTKVPEIPLTKKAYVFETSRTSGDAMKDPECTHESYLNQLNAMCDMKFKKHQKVMGTAPITFDASKWDIAVIIATFGTLFITSDRERLFVHRIVEIIRNNLITFAAFLPTFLAKLPPDLQFQYLVSMGQFAIRSVLLAIKKANPQCIIFNGYGPTEGGICSHLHDIKFVWDAKLNDYQIIGDIRNIGKPISNMQMFVLNSDTLASCPLGVRGELFLKGPGLAIGYRSQPALTKLKFIHVIEEIQDDGSILHKRVPEPTAQSVTYYATGDAGFYMQYDDGVTIVPSGSCNNDIVKIHGVNVSLSSVANTIFKINECARFSLASVKEVAVVPVRDAHNNVRSLTSFVVFNKVDLSCDQTEEALKMLVDFMKSTDNPIPQHPVALPYFVPMGNLFANKNSKVVTRELEETARVLAQGEQDEAQGLIDIEEIKSFLKRLWIRVGISNNMKYDDTFYSLGGRSVELMQLFYNINNLYKLEFENIIPIGDTPNVISDEMTINSLAQTIANRLQATQPGADQRELLRTSNPWGSW